MRKLTWWEGKDAHAWQQLLNVPSVQLYETAASTNDLARERADAGAATLTVVIADHQTHGRGRGGKDWLSLPGSSLLCSIVFRIAGQGAEAPGAAPVRVGLAVAGAIQEVTGLAAAVKWPNDVVIDGSGKVAGVLCEGVFRTDDAFIVAGIGINVSHPGHDYPSLAAITGSHVSRSALLQALIDRLRPTARRMAAQLTEAELAAARARDILFGEDIESDEGLRGRACGISSDGSLTVQTAEGMRAVHSATIRLAGTRAYPGART